MKIYYLHVVIATLLSYFIVSVAYRDLIFVYYGGMIRYRGTRAIIVSLALFCLLMLSVSTFDVRYEWFNYVKLSYSFPVGVLIAWTVQRLLARFANKIHITSVPEKLLPQKVTMGRFLFFLLAGAPTGLVFGWIIYIATSSQIISLISGLFFAVFVSWILARANWIAGRNWF
jgi:hypothetical protein